MGVAERRADPVSWQSAPGRADGSAATLVMILSMTFRLRMARMAAIYTVDSFAGEPGSNGKCRSDGRHRLCARGAYILLGLMLALGDPILRFLWITAGFFIGFWAMSALRNYAASIRSPI